MHRRGRGQDLRPWHARLTFLRLRPITPSGEPGFAEPAVGDIRDREDATIGDVEPRVTILGAIAAVGGDDSDSTLGLTTVQNWTFGTWVEPCSAWKYSGVLKPNIVAIMFEGNAWTFVIYVMTVSL